MISMTSQSSTSEEAISTIQQSLDSEPISQYITECLQDSLEEGLILIGRQGGYIFKEQGSITPKAAILTTQNNQDIISYLIKQTPLQAPWYPCFTPQNPPYFCNFTNNITLFPKLYSYSFGRSNLAFLTKNQGPLSIQEQLEYFMEKNTKECINLPSLINLPELAGYNLTQGNLTIDVNFGINDVSAALNYPTKIKVNNKEITQTKQYGVRINLRFKKIHSAVLDMIQKDNNFLDYDIIKDTKQGFFMSDPLKFRELFGADIIKKPLNNYESLIIINDSLSKIKGENYVFQFAVQNRPPVLDLIEKKIVFAGNPVKLQPTAKDPDEHPIYYSYSGWKTSPEFFTSYEDIGSHEIKVSASDSQFEDFQDTYIQICDSQSHIGELPDICVSDCGAATECNNLAIFSLTDSCTFNQYLKDRCDETCQIIKSNICGCSAPALCTGQEQFSLIPGGWCYGISGCQLLCQTEVVRKGAQDPSNLWECSCSPSNSGSDCDSDFNGIFEGSCQNSVCIPN